MDLWCGGLQSGVTRTLRFVMLLTGTGTHAVEGTTGSQGLTEEGPPRVTVGVRLIRLLSLRCLATDSSRGLLRGPALTLTRNMITGGEGILTRPKLKCTLHVVQYVP